MSNIIESESEKIKTLLNEMYLYKNPELLEDIKKTIRKNVPLPMRGNLLAYLYVINPNFSLKTASDSNSSKKATEKKNPVQKPALKAASDGTSSLYISVGKMNRVSPSAIVQFVANGAGLKNSDILSLSYRQNYSFITVKNEHAQLIIDKVNGAVQKGRKIRVNFAKDANGSN